MKIIFSLQFDVPFVRSPLMTGKLTNYFFLLLTLLEQLEPLLAMMLVHLLYHFLAQHL